MRDTNYSPVDSRPPSSDDRASLLGQTLLLVGAALGLSAVGVRLGRDLPAGAAIAVSLGALGMLIIQAVGGQRFRIGALAIGWLFAVGLVIGLGLGPTLAYYAAADPTALTQAAVSTALIVTAMGAGGLSLDKDLVSWLRPLTFVLFGLVVVTLVLFLIGSSGSPLLSLAIAGVSAILILVDFNYLRQHGTEDDVVYLATGIFVSVVNIFLSLLNIFSRE